MFRYVPKKAASLTKRGPSHKIYSFSISTPQNPDTLLDEQWMEEMCITTEEQPALLVRIGDNGKPVTPAGLPDGKFKESIYNYAKRRQEDNVVKPRPLGKTPAQEKAELLKAKAIDKAQEAALLASTYFTDEILDESISAIVAAADKFFNADIKLVDGSDLPFVTRSVWVQNIVAKDPQDRSTLLPKIEELLEDAEKAIADLAEKVEKDAAEAAEKEAAEKEAAEKEAAEKVAAEEAGTADDETIDEFTKNEDSE